MSFDLKAFYDEKAAWSLATFGPAQGVEGVIAHLRKELGELAEAIASSTVGNIREELADICLLAIDLSWRAGGGGADFKGVAAVITPASALDYITRHLNSTVPPRPLAVLVWDIAFRALGCDATPIENKFSLLKTRTWPDWRTVAPDQPIEHVRAPTTINVGSAAHDPAAIATKVQDGLRVHRKPGTFSAFAPTATATVLVRELGPDELARPGDLKSIADLVREWRERGEAAGLVAAERAEWTASNDLLRQERRAARVLLGAQPYESLTEAIGRVTGGVRRLADALGPNHEATAEAVLEGIRALHEEERLAQVRIAALATQLAAARQENAEAWLAIATIEGQWREMSSVTGGNAEAVRALLAERGKL